MIPPQEFASYDVALEGIIVFLTLVTLFLAYGYTLRGKKSSIIFIGFLFIMMGAIVDFFDEFSEEFIQKNLLIDYTSEMSYILGLTILVIAFWRLKK